MSINSIIHSIEFSELPKLKRKIHSVSASDFAESHSPLLAKFWKDTETASEMELLSFKGIL